ncbi:hypothetical protein GQ602_005395 [Ophiocordyceps camponoti-floridani]|uniref:Uncharacterized protein n=1 Tax=Ophiocordyceps camponoti-floridani TaxID=2030778 RepID=A0A8H4Q638_9HYPO|nr:hypothetical protein GQ602_005395 [Ophiocordyceps camponoti-floridani]
MEEQFSGRTDDDLFYDDVEPVESAAIVVTESQPQEPHPPPFLSSSIFADSSAVGRAPIASEDISTHRNSKNPRTTSPNTAANAEARLKSGSNPRQKLTDEELAAKMEKMKLLAAEQSRKFQAAEQDERQHAASYARGMEEARRRRVDEVGRRRRADEDRRNLDDERARNRERKLKAMGIKDGGWDEGKTAAAEEDARRGFRSAHGGVRGVKGAAAAEAPSRPRHGRDAADRADVDRFLPDRRPGGFRASSTRGGVQGRSRDAASALKAGEVLGTAAPALTVDEFPALPLGASERTGIDLTSAKKTSSVMPPLPTPPAVGKWDDEMEALDDELEALDAKRNLS